MDASQPLAFRQAGEAVSIAELFLRALQGEEAAFKALYDGHKARVYSICLAITKTQSVAEKLTRDVFISIFRTISDFHDERQLARAADRRAVRFATSYLRGRHRP